MASHSRTGGNREDIGMSKPQPGDIRLILRPLASDVPVPIRLRRLLKTLRRAYTPPAGPEVHRNLPGARSRG